MTTTISIITPSYNSGRYLRDALDSALGQVPPPHEVIVQDGGSTDETIAIRQEYGDRISWVSEPDGGQSDALNRALARATGDVVIWLNADDILVSGAVAAAMRAFTSDRSLAFAYGDYDMVTASGHVIRHYRSNAYSWQRVYRQGCYIFSGALFIRRDALIRIGGFDPSLRACMDLDLMLRLDRAGRSIHLGAKVAQFRMHGVSKSSTIGPAFITESIRVRRRYAGKSPRMWFEAVRSTLVLAIMQTLSPLRYSRWWPRHGRTKSL